MTMNELIMKAREKKCSDIHISEGMPVSFRIHGQLLDSGFSFPAAETREMILSMLSDEQREQLENGDDVDFAIETPDYCRQRVNVFRQMKKVAATIRLLNNTIPTLEQLQMPKVLRDLADQPRGLILVTGPTGSGKSTTLSAMIDYINKNRSEHIITIEDPVEYVYESGMSVFTSVKSAWIPRALQRPCVLPSVKTLMSFSWEKCVTTKRFPPLSLPQKQDTWSCPLCTPPVRHRRWIVSLTAVRPTPRTRSGHSCPRF